MQSSDERSMCPRFEVQPFGEANLRRETVAEMKRGTNVNLSEVEYRISKKNTAVNCQDLRSPSPSEVLAELVELLEEYGPSWYTEEQHNRAMMALQR
jgi:hypothetical protein